MQKEISDFYLHDEFDSLIPYDYDDQHFDKKSFFNKVYQHQKKSKILFLIIFTF